MTSRTLKRTRRKAAVALAGAASAALLFAGSAGAATFTAADTNELMAAITTANSTVEHDTINLVETFYLPQVPIVISRSLTITGDHAHQAFGGGPTIDGSAVNPPESDAITVLSGAIVRFEAFTYQGASLIPFAALQLNPNATVILDHMAMIGHGGRAIDVEAGGNLTVNNTNIAQGQNLGLFNNGTTVLNNSNIIEMASGGIVNNNSLALNNSVLATNPAPNCFQPPTTTTNSMSDDPTCGPGVQVIADPLLGFFNINGGPTLTQRPLPGSPLINAGSNANCRVADVRFFRSRVLGDNCDIGAYQVGNPANNPADQFATGELDGSRDLTPPTCVVTGGTVGPPKTQTVTLSDGGSGVGGNALPAEVFSVQPTGTPLPGPPPVLTPGYAQIANGTVAFAYPPSASPAMQLTATKTDQGETTRWGFTGRDWAGNRADCR